MSKNKTKFLAATAMLMVSVLALSTASYAWFTLGTSAKVENIKLTATAADGLEISLGKGVAATGGVVGVTAPVTDTDGDWAIGLADFASKSYTNQVLYYPAKLMPASSNDGTNLFYLKDYSQLDQTDRMLVVSSTGTVDAGTFAAAVTTDAADAAAKATSSTAAATADEGYYIDIPIWFRTMDSAATIKLTSLTIKDADTTANDTLFQAVRVAFLDGTTVKGGILADDAAATTKAVTGTAAISTTNQTVTKEAAITSTASIDLLDLSSAAVSTAGYYAGNVIMRVWIEGQDTACQNTNAEKTFQIDLGFDTK